MCLPLNACDALLFQMSEERLITISNRDPLRFQATLGPAGWARVDALQATRPHSDKAFVAMAFAPQMGPAYEHGIRPALEDCGFVAPFRVDDIEHDTQVNEAHFKQRIDDRIMAEIHRAGLVIVDVTLARPAVYFEAGFAQGLGTRIIWTCKEDSHADMCFDTRRTGHILWTDPADLRTKLTNRVRAYGWHPKP